MIPKSFVKTIRAELTPNGKPCQRIRYQHPEGFMGEYLIEVPTAIRVVRDLEEALEGAFRRAAPHLFVGQPEPDNSMIARYLDGRMGPLLSVKDGLGLFFGDTEDDAVNCLAGWMFINRATATKEQVQDAIDSMKQGRENWPERDK
jgi:hypothetical protein